MIIREDFDTKLRDALAIHYGLDKVYVEKIHPIVKELEDGNVVTQGFDAYRINIKINDKLEWDYYLDKSLLLALRDCFVLEDLVKVIIDEFEKDKRGVIDDN